jgi:glutathione peroxidase
MVLAAVVVAAAVGCGYWNGTVASEEKPMKSVYDFTVKDIDGKDASLGQYRGKVVMIVNVASKCGFTPQYAGLQRIYDQYKDKGLVVLGFPANDFLWQEPGTDAEIKSFCAMKYSVTFPMFAKISVKGGDMHPLYKFLTEEASNPGFGGKITWNFNKFLLDRTGKTVARFATRTAPEDKEVTAAIEKALGE